MEVLEIIRNMNWDNGEFDGLSDATVEWWIEFCRPFVSKKKFGIFYERALALVVCHFMTMAGVGKDAEAGDGLAALGVTAGRGNIASLSEGGSSISFGSYSGAASGGKSVEDEYSRTLYGRQYLALLRMVIVPITIDGV